MGIKYVVIYQAVTLELYYYHLYHTRFRFISVLARPDTLDGLEWKKKSLSKVISVLSNDGHWIGKYQRVIIVDDQETRAWSSAIPEYLLKHDVQVLCLTPSTFSFGASLRPEYRIEMIQSEMNQALWFQGQDQTLGNILPFLNAPVGNETVSASTQLVWKELSIAVE